jgi:hypothetical protein
VVGKYDQIANTFVNKAMPMEMEMCPPDPDVAVNPTFSDKETPMEVGMCPPDPDVAVNQTFFDKEPPMEVQMCPPDPDHGVKPSLSNKSLESNVCSLSRNEVACDHDDFTSFGHPTTDGELIYFFIDVPRLLKCIRNNIFTVKGLQVLQEIRNVY